MAMQINKDTILCISLAARPSNFGTRFHNYLYDSLGINYLYKAFTTTDLAASLAGVRGLSIRGCAMSMPFKEACIPMVDELDASSQEIHSVNTIVNTEGRLKGYNTDYIAISKLLSEHQVSNELSFALKGSGGMAKAVVCALKNAGFKTGFIVSRNEMAGRSLAERYGFTWQQNMEKSHVDFLINVTPVGMTGGPAEDALSFSKTDIENAKVIFDVVSLPSVTPLIGYAQLQGKKVITGAEVFAIQAVEQFVLYTGIRPSDEQFRQAARFAQG